MIKYFILYDDFKEYKEPFSISETSEIKAYTEDKEQNKAQSPKLLHIKRNNYSIDIKTQPSDLYFAGGKMVYRWDYRTPIGKRRLARLSKK
jgi:uncharacterized protein with ParB-like and HNH nuclease domain